MGGHRSCKSSSHDERSTACPHSHAILFGIDVVAALVPDDCCDNQANVLKELDSFKQQELHLFPRHCATREEKPKRLLPMMYDPADYKR